MALNTATGVVVDWNRLSITQYMLVGAVSAGLAAMVTTPIDLVKTRLQTQNEAADKGEVVYTSVWRTVKSIRNEGGSLWAGAVPRALFIAPSIPLWLLFYSQSKRLFLSQ